MATVNDMPSK